MLSIKTFLELALQSPVDMQIRFVMNLCLLNVPCYSIYVPTNSAVNTRDVRHSDINYMYTRYLLVVCKNTALKVHKPLVSANNVSLKWNHSYKPFTGM